MTTAIARLCFLFLLSFSFSIFAESGKIHFIYVHGFGERRFPPAFEKKAKKYIIKNNIDARISTFRWDSKELNPFIVFKQWDEAKKNADKFSHDFAKNVIDLNENKKQKYVIIAYSLGSRLVHNALQQYDKPLKYLSGIYFMGAALEKDIAVNYQALPNQCKIQNYYSSYLDGALKFSFYVAEGKEAGGEVGFSDLHFENYRTMCTHVHKGGPIQRDYSDLSRSLIDQIIYQENIASDPGKLFYNWELQVGEGSLHWNDVLRKDDDNGEWLFQHNVNTDHYRAIFISKEGKRIRKGWSSRLLPLLQTFLKK